MTSNTDEPSGASIGLEFIESVILNGGVPVMIKRGV